MREEEKRKRVAARGRSNCEENRSLSVRRKRFRRKQAIEWRPDEDFMNSRKTTKRSRIDKRMVEEVLEAWNRFFKLTDEDIGDIE